MAVIMVARYYYVIMPQEMYYATFFNPQLVYLSIMGTGHLLKGRGEG